MKKRFLLLGILFLTLISINAFGQTYGDVDDSSNVDIIDALKTAQYYIGLPVPYFNESMADVDTVNGVSIVDALMIAQFSVGLINKFPADDLRPTPTPVQDKENIINGDFADGTASWIGGFYSPGAGNMSVNNGELHINITNGGTATWNVQIYQGNITIVSGTTYTFSFDARSVSPRTIEANVGMTGEPYTSYFASSSLSLSTTMTNYSFTFTATANDSSARVEFNCGLDSADLYIDNVSLSGGSGTVPTPGPEAITFTDPNLEAAVRAEINIPEGPIYNSDVYNLGNIYLGHMEIKDISGMEYFTGLSELILNNNHHIENIKPLEKLTNLKRLNLGVVDISDLTPLAPLTNLTQLSLVVNNIQDLSPLENLTKLTSLLLEFNEIVNIAPLATLTNVTTMTLNDNDIRDISSLAFLTKLTSLDLSNNQISDVSPLASLTRMSYLNLCGNPISDITALGNMRELKTLVLNVRVLEDITPLANLTNLISLNLCNNQIKDITPLANLTNLNVLFIGGNPLNDSAQEVIDSLRANGTRVVYTP